MIWVKCEDLYPREVKNIDKKACASVGSTSLFVGGEEEYISGEFKSSWHRIFAVFFTNSTTFAGCSGMHL